MGAPPHDPDRVNVYTSRGKKDDFKGFNIIFDEDTEKL
jgi:hypothetical protein